MAQFNENVQLTRNTFPSLQELTVILYEEQFNRILNIVKTRILNAYNNIPPLNNNVARLLNNEFNNIPMQVITDVKTFLQTQKGYTITDSEDINGNIIGWRINLPA